MGDVSELTSQPRFTLAIVPEKYEKKLSVEESLRAVGSSCVQGRGWSFPYLDEGEPLIGPGEEYVGGNVDFTGGVSHLEEWRLYRSGQFLFRMRPWEVPDEDWQRRTRDRLERLGKRIPPELIGYLSFELTLYTVTEAYIFASRLSEAVPYESSIEIRVGFRGVKGYALASAEPSRPLYDIYMSPIDNPHHNASIALDALVADPKGLASSALTSLFRQFRWMRSPSPETIAQRQHEYYR